MDIYIVRHGQTDSNLSKVFNTLTEDINENGIRQAEELRDKIKDINFDVIYCSPLKRAVHTKDIINVNNIETIYDERLEERNPGSLAGKTWDTVEREKYWNYYINEVYFDEESIEHLCSRIDSFLNDLKEKNYNKVLIVAHSGVSKAFYKYFNGVPEDGALLKLGLKNGDIKEYKLYKE